LLIIAAPQHAHAMRTGGEGMSGANGLCPAPAGTFPPAGMQRNPAPSPRPVVPQDHTMLMSKRGAAMTMGISASGGGSCILAWGTTP
jgi:hypothetical protein